MVLYNTAIFSVSILLQSEGQTQPRISKSPVDLGLMLRPNQ